MINSVSLTGRLTKEPELRYTQSGVAVMNFIVAVNRRYESSDGTKADFVNCVAFRKTAETMANHLQKGSLIGIEGRIQTRNYENNEGQRIYITEVVTDNFSFLESKNQSSNSNQGYSKGNSQGNYQNSTQSNYMANNNTYNDEPIDISDDDLPF